MLNKSTEGHFVCVWLIVVLVTCTTCYTAASGCNSTTVLGYYDWIVFPTNSGYCEMSLINTKSHYYNHYGYHINYKLSFSDFYLDCRSEYVEIWSLYPRKLLRHYCGHMGNKEVRIGKLKDALVKYSVNSSLGERYRLYYSSSNLTDTGYKTTTKIKGKGHAARIYFPQDCSYSENSIITPDNSSFKLTFSDFNLDCRSEYVKIWYLYPKRLLRHYCGHMRNKVVRINQQYALIQYSASSSSEHDELRYLQYKGYSMIPNRPGHNRKRGIGTTAIVILLAVLILIGALVCGIGLAHYRRPRRRRQRRQPSVLQHIYASHSRAI